MEQSSEQSADRSMDQVDGRWLTYPELAVVRGIDKPSAIRLATRKKWRRQRDNRRVVRVLVPPEWLAPRYQSMERSGDNDMDLSSDRTEFAAALAAVEAAHAGEVAALHGQIAGLKTMADSAAARVMDAEAALIEANRRADTSRALAERTLVELHDTSARVTDLQRELETARGKAQAAQDAAEDLRREREAGQARGRWARLRAAWRGDA